MNQPLKITIIVPEANRYINEIHDHTESLHRDLAAMAALVHDPHLREKLTLMAGQAYTAMMKCDMISLMVNPQ